MDGFLYSATPTAIPVGLYTSAGRDAPVYLYADFLLGPEAAHLNISGVSGLATKTSAVEFLLASIFAHFPAHKGRVAAVCFNVKGPDLCSVDQPGDLSAEDRHRYERLGVPSTPFERVQLYAPLKADGVNLNTLRTHPDLVGDVEPLTWGLQEVVDYAEVLLNRDDIDAKADAFIDFLRDRVLGRTFDDGFGTTHRVQTFADLDRLFRSIFDGLDISERGRYLGLVLFGAEQFRSQVHRRVVGNAGTQLFGRMDMDELATPGYQVLTPATKSKLATLPIGELMVRHPHFTQPIFVRFPKPPVLRGRDGVERFPPAADVPFDDAVVRQLVRLDRRVRPNQIKDLLAERDPDDVRRALAAVRRTRPDDVLAYFRKVLGARVVAEAPPAAPREHRAVQPLNPISDEPY